MKPFTLLSLTAVITLGGFPRASFAKAAVPVEGAERPNILYFYVDDMGWGSLGPNAQFERKAAGKPHLITPTLDQLAAQGVNFRRSYGCTVCSPARSSQQSGFHQGHTFADQNDPDNAKKAMRADDILMGDALSKAGYVTGYWGKWGYGGSLDQANPEILNVQTLPTRHGYDYVVAELHHVRAHTFFQPTLWTAPAQPGSKGGLELSLNSMGKYVGNPLYPETPALQNHPDYPQTAYCDDVYAFAALDFVRTQARHYNATGRPFFGLLAVQVPHAPFSEITQLPEWDKAYRDLPFFNSLSDQAKQWAAMITRIDGHFGNILAALEDPNGDGDTSDSVADNTLVIFQSDNGGPNGPSNDEFDANGGLRAYKGSIEEGGIRIPTLMRWPGKIASNTPFKAGTNTGRIIDVTDLLPTFCELAGVEAPLGIDGVSLAPSLLGSGYQREREFLIHEAGNGQSIIRGQYKLIRSKSGLQLFDLEADHAEAHDISAEHPKLVGELETLLLGERVDEPAGFANTYHHWRGKDGASATKATNWSDYEYANAGIVYTTDDGAPRLSWTALMENTGSSDSVAQGDRDLEFLGLEVRGGSAKQALVLRPGVKLTGRNEIRISEKGVLTLNESKVSSLRWINVNAGGELSGTGQVAAQVFNDGKVAAAKELRITGDYRESEEAILSFAMTGSASPQLKVQGTATLAGQLDIHLDANFKATKGKVHTILSADRITGRFANSGDQLVANDGTRFKVGYTHTAVTITTL